MCYRYRQAGNKYRQADRIHQEERKTPVATPVSMSFRSFVFGREVHAHPPQSPPRLCPTGNSALKPVLFLNLRKAWTCPLKALLSNSDKRPAGKQPGLKRAGKQPGLKQSRSRQVGSTNNPRKKKKKKGELLYVILTATRTSSTNQFLKSWLFGQDNTFTCEYALFNDPGGSLGVTTF